MPVKLENHSNAWSRMYTFRNSVKGSSWQTDMECPIRMRGYTELVFGNLDKKLRKKVDTALRRGYALENSTQLPILLRMITKFCPIANVPIGYIGKTDLEIYVPCVEDAKNMRDELNALSVLTDSFKGSKITHGYNKRLYGYECVTARTLAKGAGGRTGHLVSAFTSLRPSIDQWMEKDAAIREEVARWAGNVITTIRIPFDSHKDRK